MRHRLSSTTRRLLDSQVTGYAMQAHQAALQLDEIRSRSGRQELVRLDLGINPDGCHPQVARAAIDSEADYLRRLHHYPDYDERLLTRPLADLHGIPPEWVVLSAGLDQMIALIADCFLEPGDAFIQPVPSFFLFEAYSCRAGADPLYLELDPAAAYDWTAGTLESLTGLLERHHPRIKLLWLANPNNPTGRLMDPDLLHRVVDLAVRHELCVVVDEAYGEYCDPSGGVASASALLGRHANLVVLRTFSKAWGLANVRVACALTGNPHIAQALRAAHLYFPLDNRAINLARIALEHLPWLDQVRGLAARRRQHLEAALRAPALAGSLDWVASQTGVMMLAHRQLPGAALTGHLADQGILVAPAGTDRRTGRGFVRVTLADTTDLDQLVQALSLVPDADCSLCLS